MLNCPSHNLTRRHGPFPLILPLKCRILYGEHVTAVVKAPTPLFILPSLHGAAHFLVTNMATDLSLVTLICPEIQPQCAGAGVNARSAL